MAALAATGPGSAGAQFGVRTLTAGGKAGGENRLNFKPRREKRGREGETQYEENISAILSPNKNGGEKEKGEEGGQTQTHRQFM